MALVKLTKENCTQAFKDLKEADIPLIASSLAFTTILSVVPFFALALLALKGISGAEFLSDKFESIAVRFFQGTAGTEVGPQIEQILRRVTTKELGITSAVALFVTSLRLFLRVEFGVNRIWETNEERPWWRRGLLALGFYLLIPLGLALYGGFRFGALKEIFDWSPLFWDALVIFCALLFVNHWVPAAKVPWRVALQVALLSTFLLLGLQLSFSWAAREVFGHSKLYGSLAALPLFCIWVVAAWWVILLGVSVAASLTRQSKPHKLSPF